jgi:hypothetical protein
MAPFRESTRVNAPHRLTKGLQVGASEQELRRGEEVEALVTISSAGGLREAEVGLVCTEIYDHEDTSTDVEGNTQISRATSAAIAHEAWVPVENTPDVQSVGFTVPPEAPFSYEGSCLSFKWEVVARGRRRRRLDALARRGVSVLSGALAFSCSSSESGTRPEPR